MSSKVNILILHWYIKTFINLPFGKILHRIASKGVHTKQDLRQFEKLALKLASYQQHLRYFDRCIELDLIPDFIKFKPPHLEVYKEPKMYYRQVLKEQRRLVSQSLKEIRAEYNSFLTYLRTSVSTLEFRLFMVLLQKQSVQKLILDKNNTHNKKLYSLWQKQCPDTPECIVNYSNYKLNLS